MSLVTVIYNKIPGVKPLFRIVRKWYSRKSLKMAIMRSTQRLEPIRIVIGSNTKYQEGWIPTEQYSLNILSEEDWKRYFSPSSISSSIAEHVWEHLTEEEGKRAAMFCHRYLKPGGHLRVAVPDGLFPDADYINFVKPGGYGPSADDHKVLYTHDTLSSIFTSAGFSVRLLEYYDETGTFHVKDWKEEEGKIVRSNRAENARMFGGRKYTSLILDAIKPNRNE